MYYYYDLFKKHSYLLPVHLVCWGCSLLFLLLLLLFLLFVIVEFILNYHVDRNVEHINLLLHTLKVAKNICFVHQIIELDIFLLSQNNHQHRKHLCYFNYFSLSLFDFSVYFVRVSVCTFRLRCHLSRSCISVCVERVYATVWLFLFILKTDFQLFLNDFSCLSVLVYWFHYYHRN